MDQLRTELHGVFSELRDELSNHLSSRGFESSIVEHFNHCFLANVGTGKLHRGLAVLYIGKELGDGRLSDEDQKQLCLLGWLVEMMQAHYLILDDIMDESTTRRGEPCWYRRPEIGLMAINDAGLLKSCIFFLLKTHFHKHPSYRNFVDLFIEAGHQTELGQLCDLAASKERQIKNFAMKKYMFLVEQKSSYSIYVPIALVLEYWQLMTTSNGRQSYNYAIALTEYFQVHDDYIDVYGDSTITGKVGTDIQDNKCTWLINQALLLANETQKRELQEAYGVKDPNQVAKVKEIFGELGIQQAYTEYAKQQREKIEDIIGAVDESEGIKRHVFLALFQGFKKGR